MRTDLRAFLFAAFAFSCLSFGIGQSEEKRVVNSAFSPILGKLKSKARIAIYLPTFLPSPFTGQFKDADVVAYAVLREATPTSYAIHLFLEPDCEAAACFLASIYGQKVTSSSGMMDGDKVSLHGNIQGYFWAADCDGAHCNQAVLAWRYNGVEYAITEKGGSQEALVRSANSAIDFGPV